MSASKCIICFLTIFLCCNACIANKDVDNISVKHNDMDPNVIFKKLKVVGVRLITFSCQENKILPFHHSAGYAIAIVGELSRPVTKISDGALNKAVSDNGESLLTDNKQVHRIIFPELSKDKRYITFKIDLALPTKNVKFIRKISGSLNYMIFGDAKKVDLGIQDIAPGITGRNLSAKIMSIENNPFDEEEQILSIKIHAGKDFIRSVNFYDLNGKKLCVSEVGYYEYEKKVTTFEYSLKGKFPKMGRIEVFKYDNVKYMPIQFELNNISLLGQTLTIDDIKYLK